MRIIIILNITFINELIMRQILFLSLVAVCGFFISTSIIAQDAEVEEVVVKGKVLQSDQVNALKTPTPIINVPQSLSIITDDEMLKKGMRSVGDIIRYTPGVNTSQGEGHRDAVAVSYTHLTLPTKVYV